MATSAGAPSFDDIIQADRQRRKNEQLAIEIFSKNRRSTGAGNAARKNNQTTSLASRVGIGKRSSSTSVPSSKANPFGQPKPPSRPSSAAAQHARANRLASAVNNTEQANILPSPQAPKAQSGSGLSIRGTAGPFVVQASNFAPGTTAADIEAAMHTVAIDATGNSGLVTCRILTNNPTVMAEMIFSERYIADKVVETFNNEKADGRILHVYHKHGGPSPAVRRKRNEPAVPVPDTTPASGPKELFDVKVSKAEDVDMDTESPYNNAREVADQDRRSREERRADSNIQDGRFGFTNGRDRDQVQEKPREALPPGDGADQRMDDEPMVMRRDEPRERRYDSRYSDRRDDRGSYRRENRYDGYRRDDRPSHYGNGVGGSGYRGGDSYGRMYSDDMMRGPPRGSRGGGPRGGYR
ncbi:hypothetical protein EPUS_01616 [Endocarpon pusillum Z07020]|uniref:RRM domain-containing protein n=1 Tax=Endocarpon pusillum (strain Z07020 / HMAS-L-300199) TaxID=1263415 RepID=U1GUR5_ENDPU|nr:uncharacterized protein EPUS_01616 [Endocarpon pusillum Z07020]ERF75786.1 hypothetical protein EPUS_01616 [Endocarpon pusillum Z07020]